MKKKQEEKKAPITHGKRKHDPLRTAENKRRNIEREAKRQAKAALKRLKREQKHSVPIDHQKPVNPLLLSQRLKAQQIHQTVKQKVNRVNLVRLAKNLFTLEERAHVHA